jgi:hypothetical protein
MRVIKDLKERNMFNTVLLWRTQYMITLLRYVISKFIFIFLCWGLNIWS